MKYFLVAVLAFVLGGSTASAREKISSSQFYAVLSKFEGADLGACEAWDDELSRFPYSGQFRIAEYESRYLISVELRNEIMMETIATVTPKTGGPEDESGREYLYEQESDEKERYSYLDPKGESVSFVVDRSGKRLHEFLLLSRFDPNIYCFR